MAIVLQTIIVSCIIFISGISFAITGFGPSIIFHIGYWSFVSMELLPVTDISTVVVYLALSVNIVAMGQALYSRKYIRFQPKFSAVYAISSCIATIIGIEMLTRNDNPFLIRILGIVLFMSFIANVIKDCLLPYCLKKAKHTDDNTIQNQDNDTDIDNIEMQAMNTVRSDSDNIPKDRTTSLTLEFKQTEIENDNNSTDQHEKCNIPIDVQKYELNSCKKYCGLIIACLASGFLRGMFGVGGPPMIIYFLTIDIDRRIVRSIAPLATGFGSGIPFIIHLLWIKEGFDTSEWITYLCMFIGFILGLFVGNSVHSYVDQKTFRAALTFILFCGSINLMLINLDKISMYMSVCLAVIFVLIIALMTTRIILVKIKENKKLLSTD